MLKFYDRRINKIQTIDILNSIKNSVLKWPVHREKGQFTTRVSGKHKIIFKFIKNYPKYQSIELFSYMKHQGKGKIVLVSLLSPGFLTIFEDTFDVLPLAFSMLSSPVSPRNSRFVTIT